MAHTTDRPATLAGGPFVFGRSAAAPLQPGAENAAILALADGSVWRGWSVGPARAVSGSVQVSGELVLVEGDVVGVLRGIDVDALQEHLAATMPGQGPGAMAYLTAPGAVLPIHAEVARAVARGEIGRP
jgi:hypothetical protein